MNTLIIILQLWGILALTWLILSLTLLAFAGYTAARYGVNDTMFKEIVRFSRTLVVVSVTFPIIAPTLVGCSIWALVSPTTFTSALENKFVKRGLTHLTGR